jgi:hypothetical protein
MGRVVPTYRTTRQNEKEKRILFVAPFKECPKNGAVRKKTIFAVPTDGINFPLVWLILDIKRLGREIRAFFCPLQKEYSRR